MNEYRNELSIASTAWNLSLFPPDAREDYLMGALDAQGLQGRDRLVVAHHLRELVKRKDRLFPEDRRMIANVEVLDEGDEFRVLVASLIT